MTPSEFEKLFGVKRNVPPNNTGHHAVASGKLEEVRAATTTTDHLYHKYKDFKLEFLWDNFIVKRANNFLTAEGGTGKTRMGIALCMAAKYGYSSFLGNTISIDGNILYLNYEITEPLFKVIAEPIELGVRQGIPLRQVYILNYLNNPRLTIEDAALVIEEHQIKFVVVDSFKACISRLMRERKQKELTNLNSDMYFDVLNHWREKYKVTTLTINHTNKGTKHLKTSGDLGFGPSSVRDFMDYQVFLRYAHDADRPERLLVVDKARFMEKGYCNKLIKMNTDSKGYFYFELLEDGIKEEEFIREEEKQEHELKYEIIALLDERKTYREVSELLGVSQKTIAKIKKDYDATEGKQGEARKAESKESTGQQEECPF